MTHQCTRSHPHENMDEMCELRTEIARLTNELAQVKRHEWVGLTDDEVADLGRHELWIKQFIRTVEAKLKEKNT